MWAADTGTLRFGAEEERRCPRKSPDGLQLAMRTSVVRTMRQPPLSVPNRIAAWQASTTQNDT